MKPGEITEPINYQGRYFILRRGEDVPKSFEDAKKETRSQPSQPKGVQRRRRACRKDRGRAETEQGHSENGVGVCRPGKHEPGRYGPRNGYVKPGDNIDKIGVSQQFEEGIANLENPQDVGDKTPMPDGFAIPMLDDKKPPRDAEFAEVKDQIVEVVKLDKARAQVQDIANQIASGRRRRRCSCRSGDSKRPEGTGPEIIHSRFAARSGPVGVDQRSARGRDLWFEVRRRDQNADQTRR